jgi:hypothetical protein
VCASGLWNQRHVEDEHDAEFLSVMAGSVAHAAPVQ